MILSGYKRQPIRNSKEKKRKGKKAIVRLIGQERQLIKNESKRALMNEFQTLKKFLYNFFSV